MFQKLKAAINEIGFINYLLYGINRVLTRMNLPECIFHYIFYAQPVPDKPVLPARRGKSIVVKQLQHGDSCLKELPPPEEIIESRYKQNSVCIAAFKDVELLGCIWLCLSDFLEDEVKCRYLLPANAGWDFDVYVKPEYRNGLAFIRLWDEANSYLRDNRKKWSISRISAFNVRSMSSHASMGAQPIGHAYFIKLNKFQLMVSNLPSYFHISLSSKSIPRISMDITNKM